MQKTNNVREQIPLFVPTPDQRPPGWITYNDRVVFVIMDDAGKVRIRTGHICSWPGSHGAEFEVDNVSQTIVWSDQVLNDMADCADDAHEECFDVKDPRLFKRDEVHMLTDPDKAVVWFQGVYPPETARQIAALLSRPDFGAVD